MQMTFICLYLIVLCKGVIWYHKFVILEQLHHFQAKVKAKIKLGLAEFTVDDTIFI